MLLATDLLQGFNIPVIQFDDQDADSVIHVSVVTY